MTDLHSHGALARVVGLPGAILIGLGSILGTGVFVSIALGASVAGGGVVIAIALAAIVAMCNGLSSAQLAASHPVSGGTYEYGHRYLVPWLGFTAGWMFLCAKSASAAAAAIGFAMYALAFMEIEHDGASAAIAVGAIILIAFVILWGMRRTNVVNATVVTVVLLSLVVFVVPGLWLARDSIRIDVLLQSASQDDASNGEPVSMDALLTATALMFVAFTGYGRIATLGEEVREPRRIIPAAVIVTLVLTAALYVLVALAATWSVGVETFASLGETSASPLAEIARLLEQPWLVIVISIGALFAMLSVLLNLILGLSRVALAMGRRGDLPVGVARISPAGDAAPIATILVTCAIIAIAVLTDFAHAWAFSAFTVLIYYGITNLAALRLSAEERLYPRWIAAAGLVFCLSLAAFIDWRVIVTGSAILILGLVLRALGRRVFRRA